MATYELSPYESIRLAASKFRMLRHEASRHDANVADSSAPANYFIGKWNIDPLWRRGASDTELRITAW